MSGGGLIELPADGFASFGPVSSGTVLSNIDNTIAGAGFIEDFSSLFTLVNGGVIVGSVAGQSLQISIASNAVVNSGTLEATTSGGSNGGGLSIGGTIISNTSTGVILASGSGALVTLNSCIINGGTLKTVGSGAAVEPFGPHATLVNVTNSGLLEVKSFQPVELAGTSFTNNGIVAIVSTGNQQYLQIDNSLTLRGGGSIDMTDSQATIDVGSATPVILTNDNTISGTGQIGGFADGLLLVNSGTIVGNNSATDLEIRASSSTTDINAGTLESTVGGGGGLTVEANFANSGTVEAVGQGAFLGLEFDHSQQHVVRQDFGLGKWGADHSGRRRHRFRRHAQDFRGRRVYQIRSDRGHAERDR